jgi:hypothetical protein
MQCNVESELLSCLYHSGKDRTENTVPVLVVNCCLADRAENTIPLLFADRCLATAAVQSPTSWLPPSYGPTCHNARIASYHCTSKRYELLTFKVLCLADTEINAPILTVQLQGSRIRNPPLMFLLSLWSRDGIITATEA